MPFKKGNTYGKALKGRKLTEEHKENLRQALTGRKLSEEHIEKIKIALSKREHTEESKEKVRGEKHPNWKGDCAGYYAIHCWIRRVKGKACKCTICGTKTAKRYDWANIDHSWKRNPDDYIEMCRSCHKKYDLTLI